MKLERTTREHQGRVEFGPSLNPVFTLQVCNAKPLTRTVISGCETRCHHIITSVKKHSVAINPSGKPPGRKEAHSRGKNHRKGPTLFICWKHDFFGTIFRVSLKMCALKHIYGLKILKNIDNVYFFNATWG